MEEELKNILDKAEKDIKLIDSTSSLYKSKSLYLGKKGSLSSFFMKLRDMNQDEKKCFGKKLSEAKELIEELYLKKKKELDNIELEKSLLSNTCDVTIPSLNKTKGKINYINKTRLELSKILTGLGFNFVSGPEIEDEFHVFDALNIPDNHPARQMHDTFYLNKKDTSRQNEKRMLLRTHTSSVQIRAIKKMGIPVKIASYGKVYRNDLDTTHSPMFHQIEGLYISKNVTMGHMKWTLEYILEKFFNTKVKTKFRPSFFPFTEPSAELDVNYEITADNKINIGKGNKMMEILGCGMVHPKVIENLGFNSDEFSGFAFGLGIERITMLKFGIPDIRSLFKIDLR